MKRLVDILVKVQSVLAVLFLVIFVLAVILQVATRYVPGFAWLWTEQIANYTFIWSVLMGAAVGVRHGEHFFLSILTERLSAENARRNGVLVQGLIGLFGLFLLYHGLELTKSFWEWSLTSLPRLKQGYFWMALPVCGFTTAVYAFLNAYELCVTSKDETPEPSGMARR